MKPYVTIEEAIGGLPEPFMDKRPRKQKKVEQTEGEAEVMSRQWDEARIIAPPLANDIHNKKSRNTGVPRVLVRRTAGALTTPDGRDAIYFEGNPCISLFTGCGGFDVGTEEAGLIPVVQHEWDASCCWTLLANRPHYFRNSALIQGDIYQTPTEMILREGGLRVGECFMLTGGPPCQGFSVAGVRDPNDLRNDLIFQFLRVIREAQPKFFCMENVAGILTAAKGEYFRRFLRTAYNCFYELVYGLVDCVEYGVPQHRVRFICMGTRRDMFALDNVLASLPEPQCFSKRDIKAMDWMEGAQHIDLLAGLECYDEELALLRHPPGIRYFPDRPILVPPRPTHGVINPDDDGGRSKSFIEFYRNLRANEPDRIVTKETKWEEPSLIIRP